jgi:hypothetical protein
MVSILTASLNNKQPSSSTVILASMYAARTELKVYIMYGQTIEIRLYYSMAADMECILINSLSRDVRFSLLIVG